MTAMLTKSYGTLPHVQQSNLNSDRTAPSRVEQIPISDTECCFLPATLSPRAHIPPRGSGAIYLPDPIVESRLESDEMRLHRARPTPVRNDSDTALRPRRNPASCAIRRYGRGRAAPVCGRLPARA